MALFSPLRQLCGRDDQALVEADLAAFLGPRAEGYLAWYKRRREGLAAGGTVIGWSWTVLLSWFVWHWYRKLWLAGLVTLLTQTLGAWLVEIALGGTIATLVLLAFYIASCMNAQALLLDRGARMIVMADAQRLVGEERRAYLAGKGGVTALGALGATLLSLALLAGFCWLAWEQAMRDPQVQELMDQLNQLGQ